MALRGVVFFTVSFAFFMVSPLLSLGLTACPCQVGGGQTATTPFCCAALDNDLCKEPKHEDCLPNRSENYGMEAKSVKVGKISIVKKVLVLDLHQTFSF